MKKAIILGVIAGALAALLFTYERSEPSNSDKQSGQSTTIPRIAPEVPAVYADTKETDETGLHGTSPTEAPQEQLGEEVRGEVLFYTNDYCVKYNPGCRTASGEIFNDSEFTTACSDRWALGSTLRVTHRDVSILVRCNDRGAFEDSYGRILDLSKAAFEALSPLGAGVIEVTVTELN